MKATAIPNMEDNVIKSIFKDPIENMKKDGLTEKQSIDLIRLYFKHGNQKAQKEKARIYSKLEEKSTKSI